MILTCNSCGKKFVVPDNAITASGRMVQCGSCGNKWRQFPLGEVEKNQSSSRPQKVVSRPKPVKQKTQTPQKVRKILPKKPREISLYSPEYLAKKHGIKINDAKPQKIKKQIEKRRGFSFPHNVESRNSINNDLPLYLKLCSAHSYPSKRNVEVGMLSNLIWQFAL